MALPIWAKQFGFGDDFVSLLGAMSSNAISAGIGALIGGRICDLWGRKKIQLPAAGVTLDAAILDRIDEIVKPGVNLNPADTSYGEQVLQPALRRR